MLFPELSLHSGSPSTLWLNPNVYITSDAAGTQPVVSPIPSVPYYFWAKVVNNGRAQATNVVVDFYVCDFSAGSETYASLLKVGSSLSTQLPIGVSQIFGSTTSGTLPVTKNDVCIIAIGHDPRDPAPCPISTALVVFNDIHIAQYNLGILPLSDTNRSGVYTGNIDMNTYSEREGAVARVQQVPLTILPPNLLPLIHASQTINLPAGSYYLSLDGEDPCQSQTGNQPTSIMLPPNGRGIVTLHVSFPTGVPSGSVALLSVEQVEGETILNGAGVLAVIE